MMGIAPYGTLATGLNLVHADSVSEFSRLRSRHSGVRPRREPGIQRHAHKMHLHSGSPLRGVRNDGGKSF